MLDTYNGADNVSTRVTLLQSDSSVTEHTYKTARFKQIFRTDDLVYLNGNGIASGASTPRSISAVKNSTTSGMDTPRSVSSVPNGHNSHNGLPPGLPAALPVRPNSVVSSVASTSTDTTGPKTWAKLAQAVATQPQTDLVPRPVEAPRPTHNKKGNRIDPPLEFEYAELQRVKKIKMCNMHYLHPDGCRLPASKCYHAHEYKPTEQELKILKCVSRETPCFNGVECAETVCVYGHRCPWPVATEGSMRGYGCANGDKCRFPREMHGIKDSVPARSSHMGTR